MRDVIKPNDIVLHKPSGEKWVVAGVNYDEGRLIPMGYPFPSLAYISDCELLEERYESEFQDLGVIRYFRDHGLVSYIDDLSAVFDDDMIVEEEDEQG